MNELTGKYYIVDRRGNVLRYGINGGGMPSYCVYRGDHVVVFDTEEVAERTRLTFTFPDRWRIRKI